MKLKITKRTILVGISILLVSSCSKKSEDGNNNTKGAYASIPGVPGYGAYFNETKCDFGDGDGPKAIGSQLSCADAKTALEAVNKVRQAPTTAVPVVCNTTHYAQKKAPLRWYPYAAWAAQAHSNWLAFADTFTTAAHAHQGEIYKYLVAGEKLKGLGRGQDVHSTKDRSEAEGVDPAFVIYKYAFPQKNLPAGKTNGPNNDGVGVNYEGADTAPFIGNFSWAGHDGHCDSLFLDDSGISKVVATGIAKAKGKTEHEYLWTLEVPAYYPANYNLVDEETFDSFLKKTP